MRETRANHLRVGVHGPEEASARSLASMLAILAARIAA